MKKFFTGRRILEVYMALNILLAPVLLSAASFRVGLCVMLALGCAVLLWRTVDTEAILLSPFTAVAASLAVYAILSFLWALVKGAHLFYAASLFYVAVTAVLFGDYFTLDPVKEVKERLNKLLFVSAALCAVFNVLYWAGFQAFKVTDYRFSAGIGQSDLLGLFMFGGLLAGCDRRLLVKGRTRRWVLAGCALILFTLFMSRSPIAFLMLSLFLIVRVLSIRANLNVWSLPLVIVLAAVACAGAMSLAGRSAGFLLLKDALLSGFVHPFGMGGGGFLSMVGALKSGVYEISGPLNVLSVIVSSSGLAGLLLVLILIMWTSAMAVIRGGRTPLFTALTVLFFLFTDIAQSLAALTLFVGMTVWCESALGAVRRHKLKGAGVLALAGVFMAILMTYLGVAQATGESAAALYRAKEPERAAQRCKIAASLNVWDAEPYRILSRINADDFYETGEKEYFEKAIFYLDAVRKRDPSNFGDVVFEAKLNTRATRYQHAAELWDRVIRACPYDVENYPDYAETLLMHIGTLERGSSDAKAVYDRIVGLAGLTDDAVTVKKVNDIADAAQKYTYIQTENQSGNG